MATVVSNAFEIERRCFQWSKDNTLDDHISSLLWNDNPNNIIDGNTLGETKLYSLLPGATYFETSTGIGIWWLKIDLPNVWIKIATDSSTGTNGVFIIENFILTGTDITNGYLTLSNSPLITENISVNMNGLVLFNGSSEDYYISVDKIYFTTTQKNLLTIGDKFQISYKY